MPLWRSIRVIRLNLRSRQGRGQSGRLMQPSSSPNPPAGRCRARAHGMIRRSLRLVLTSNQAHCSLRTGTAYFRCRFHENESAGFRLTRGEFSPSMDYESPDRCGEARRNTRFRSTPPFLRSLRIAETRNARAVGSTIRSLTPTQRCTTWVGRIRLRCGATARSSEDCTAFAFTVFLPESPCFILRRTRQKLR